MNMTEEAKAKIAGVVAKNREETNAGFRIQKFYWTDGKYVWFSGWHVPADHVVEMHMVVDGKDRLVCNDYKGFSQDVREAWYGLCK